MPNERRTVYMSLDDLLKVPAPRNSKNHNIPRIKRSIARLGFIDAGVLDERTGFILGGHGRTEALAELRAEGEPAPSGVRIRKGVWEVPVQRGWSSTDDEEAEAAAVALNQLVIEGGWDREVLWAQLDAIRAKDASLLELTGFTIDDLDELALPVPGVVESPTPLERQNEFLAAGIRTVILPLAEKDYETFVGQLGALRDKYGVETNTEAVVRAVTEVLDAASV